MKLSYHVICFTVKQLKTLKTTSTTTTTTSTTTTTTTSAPSTTNLPHVTVFPVDSSYEYEDYIVEDVGANTTTAESESYNRSLLHHSVGSNVFSYISPEVDAETIIRLHRDMYLKSEMQRYDGWYNNLAHPAWGSTGKFSTHFRLLSLFFFCRKPPNP